MLDFNKITESELRQLKLIAAKAAEKSDIDKYYLFSYDSIEKAKMFVFCHRFLVNMFNLLDKGNLRKTIKQTIDETRDVYNNLLFYLEELESGVSFNSNMKKKKIFDLSNEQIVDDLIDLFSVLIEKAHVLQISKLKGIVLEGKSGKEYDKVFRKPEEKI